MDDQGERQRALEYARQQAAEKKGFQIRNINERAWCSSPGEILKEALTAHEWSIELLAIKMGWSAVMPNHVREIQEILDGSREITVHTALDLERVFGQSAEYWMNLETNYRLSIARKERAAS